MFKTVLFQKVAVELPSPLPSGQAARGSGAKRSSRSASSTKSAEGSHLLLHAAGRQNCIRLFREVSSSTSPRPNAAVTSSSAFTKDQLVVADWEGDGGEAAVVMGDGAEVAVVEGDGGEAALPKGDGGGAAVVEGDGGEAADVDGDGADAVTVERGGEGEGAVYFMTALGPRRRSTAES